MRLDAGDSDLLQIVQRRGELVDLGEGKGRVDELAGGLRPQLEVLVGQFALDTEGTETIGRDAFEHCASHIEGGRAEAGQEPLVGAAAEGVDSRCLDVDGKHAHGLNGVGIEKRTMGMGNVGDGPHVVAIAIHRRYPGNRHEAGAGVDERLQVLRLDDAVPVPCNAELNAMKRLELAIEHEGGLIVEVVDDHVVAGCPRNGVGDDVFALGGGVQEADLIRRRVDEAGELRTGGADLTEEVADAQRLEGAPLHERLAGGHHWLRVGRDVGGVEVGAAGGDGEVGPDAERVAGAGSSGSSRHGWIHGAEGCGGRQ